MNMLLKWTTSVYIWLYSYQLMNMSSEPLLYTFGFIALFYEYITHVNHFGMYLSL